MKNTNSEIPKTNSSVILIYKDKIYRNQERKLQIFNDRIEILSRIQLNKKEHAILIADSNSRKI